MYNLMNNYVLKNNFICIILILITILYILGLCHIFKQKGEKRYKAFIPLYNFYILYKLFWNTKYFWIQLTIVLPILLVEIIFPYQIVWDVTALIFNIVENIFVILLSYKIAKEYNRGIITTLGLIYLPYIFMFTLKKSN